MKKTVQYGFTLTELLLVLVIISSLATLSINRWSFWRQQQQLSVTATQLQAFLIRVREQAHWYNWHLPLWVSQQGGSWCVSAGLQDRANPQLAIRQAAGIWVWHSPYPGVWFYRMLGDSGFYGERGAAKAGSLEFGNPAGRWRIIISAQARIQLCKMASEGCL